jgi:hypothetical protein
MGADETSGTRDEPRGGDSGHSLIYTVIFMFSIFIVIP